MPRLVPPKISNALDVVGEMVWMVSSCASGGMVIGDGICVCVCVEVGGELWYGSFCIVLMEGFAVGSNEEKHTCVCVVDGDCALVGEGDFVGGGRDGGGEVGRQESM